MVRRLAAVIAVALLPVVSAAPSSAATVTRIAGSDRYATAAAVSERTFDDASVVYVASGITYADALAAAPVAAMSNAPVLLTAPSALPASTRDELQRLSPARIVVVGGRGAIDDGVVAALEEHAGEVTRVAGADRYVTATMLTASAFEPGGPVLVASGQAFPDALAGGALAGRQGAPLLLTPKDSLPASVADELDRLAPSEIIVLGGPGSVSDVVAGALTSHTEGVVRRVSGTDRYATAAEMSAEIETAGAVLLAIGTGFADALAGGAAAAALDAPVLLVTGTCLPPAVADEVARLDPDDVLVLGGTGAVGRTVEVLAACPAGSAITLEDDGTATLDELDLVWRGVVDGRAAFGDSGPILLRVTDAENDFSAGPGAAFLHGIDIYTDEFRAFASNGEWGQYNVVVHEYFHTLQHWLARRGAAHINGSVAPVWLVEGTASYFGSREQTDTYSQGGTFASVMADHEDASGETDAALCSLFTHADVYFKEDTSARLSLATVAAELLVDRYGEAATVSGIWSALATNDLPAAFAATYGQSYDSFCADVEEHRATL